MMPRDLIIRAFIVILAAYANVFTLNADTYDMPNEVLRIEYYTNASKRAYIVVNSKLIISNLLRKRETSEPLEQIPLTQQHYNKLVELGSVADKNCQKDHYYNPYVPTGDIVAFFFPSERVKGYREMSLCNTYNKALIDLTEEIDKIVPIKYKIDFYKTLKTLYERVKALNYDTSPIGLPE